MKRLVFVFALLALLAAPGPAMAKGPTTATLCGPEGCKSLGNAQQLGGFPDSGPTGEIPAPAPYYELRFKTQAGEEEHKWTTWYVPTAHLLASFDEREGVYWMQMDDPKLSALTRRVKPFPTPEITGVTIGSRSVTDNAVSYLRLFTVESTGDAVPQGLADWEPIVFRGQRMTPWTRPQSGMFFSPSNGILQRGIELVELPSGMSADIRAGDPLAGGGGSSFPWRTVLFALLAAALLVAASMIRPLRRRGFVRRAPTTA
jgi:hypothetical protein